MRTSCRRLSSSTPIDNQRRLEYWYDLSMKTIIIHQHPVTGLIPAQPGSDTWVRDCIYALHSIWALSLAFEKEKVLGTHATLHHELKHRTIKGMRGLLISMMNQQDKVNQFIETQSHLHCLHAKYETSTGNPVVGDEEWGHLQLDATSLFLLTLAQMTSSGIVIIQSLNEVDFIQNLVHYIHFAYRTPDFGVFERGDKNNRGIRELSSTSIAMAKSALVAIRDLNLFGAQGGLRSVIQVPPDMSRQCNRVMEAILPRGSISKEFDSSTLSILSYPAFAIEKETLIKNCKDMLESNLKGNYGYKRFLLDGYKTSLEDKSRLHYNYGELRNFEGIESEWPIYFIYLWLDALFNESDNNASELMLKINDLAVYDEEGFPLIPELYYVPHDKVECEKQENSSQQRLCGGKIPFIWAQSLYIIAGLIQYDFISISDIDPLNRRLSRNKKLSPIVQIVLFAEDNETYQKALDHNLPCLPFKNSKVKVITPSVVTKIWDELGLKLPSSLKSYAHHRVSTLRTSIMYHHCNDYFISVPEYAYEHVFYDNIDNEIFIQKTISRIAYLANQWHFSGRPTLAMLLTSQKLSDPPMVRFLETLKSGSFLGVQVKLCDMDVVFSTAYKQPLLSVPHLVMTSKNLYKTEKETINPLKFSNTIFQTDVDCSKLISEIKAIIGLSGKWDVIENYIDINSCNLSKYALPYFEEIYEEACQEKDWYIARHCAALLHKVQHSICDDVTHILVNQKQISFGSGVEEETITQPPTPMAFFDIIVRHSKKRFILFALYQEILNSLTQMVQKNVLLFKGILRIRLDLLIHLVAMELSSDQQEDLGAICRISPIELFRIIHGLFSGGTVTCQDDDTCSDDEESPWEHRRRIDGCLNRLPNNFHTNLFALLNKTSGIDLEGNFLPSFPMINEMTAGEPQFAINIENWFDKIQYPQLRQLYVEVIMILASLHKHMVKLPNVIKLHDILSVAHQLFLADHNDYKPLPNELLAGISQEFYLLPPTGRNGTLSYMTRSILC